ncbi:MAG: LacI family DNA-binding transcriptional regulator [Treponema sp.]|nr:LacI family DNA-binding transcriptional regulator [Treponema sp.]
MSEKVRLSDIAARFNVSTVTVSKALSGKDGVGEELRDEIKRVAEEMGYCGKSLFPKITAPVKKGTGNVGIVIPKRFFSPSASYYWYLFNYLSTELLEKGFYPIMELISQEDEDSLSLPHLLSDKKVDGLVLLGQVSEAYVKKVSEVCHNLLLLDFYTEDSSFTSVLADNFYYSWLITSKAISLGYKKLRFVGTYKATSSIQDRFLGFAKALFDAGLPVSKDDIISDRDDHGLDIPLIIPEDLPEVFVCNCDATAVKLIAALKEKGIRVPEDTCVTGFDNYTVNNQNQVPLTTVYIRPEETAAQAATLISAMIKGEEYKKGRHLAGGSLIMRESLK